MTSAHALSSTQAFTCLHVFIFHLHFTGVYGEPETGDDSYGEKLGHGQNRPILLWMGNRGSVLFLIIVTLLVFHGLNEFK